jgi:hypothetical protein
MGVLPRVGCNHTHTHTHTQTYVVEHACVVAPSLLCVADVRGGGLFGGRPGRAVIKLEEEEEEIVEALSCVLENGRERSQEMERGGGGGYRVWLASTSSDPVHEASSLTEGGPPLLIPLNSFAGFMPLSFSRAILCVCRQVELPLVSCCCCCCCTVVAATQT